MINYLLIKLIKSRYLLCRERELLSGLQNVTKFASHCTIFTHVHTPTIKYFKSKNTTAFHFFLLFSTMKTYSLVDSPKLMTSPFLSS
jgi:hypothetical protein